MTVSRVLRIAALSAAIATGFSFAAVADDFIKECKIGNAGPTADKVCGCMSEKITGSDRADAIEAMNKTNEAMAKGTAAAASGMSPKVMKSMEVVMGAQVACM